MKIQPQWVVTPGKQTNKKNNIIDKKIRHDILNFNLFIKDAELGSERVGLTQFLHTYKRYSK
jgi:hypothetical protein